MISAGPTILKGEKSALDGELVEQEESSNEEARF